MYVIERDGKSPIDLLTYSTVLMQSCLPFIVQLYLVYGISALYNYHWCFYFKLFLSLFLFDNSVSLSDNTLVNILYYITVKLIEICCYVGMYYYQK